MVVLVAGKIQPTAQNLVEMEHWTKHDSVIRRNLNMGVQIVQEKGTEQ